MKTGVVLLLLLHTAIGHSFAQGMTVENMDQMLDEYFALNSRPNLPPDLHERRFALELKIKAGDRLMYERLAHRVRHPRNSTEGSAAFHRLTEARDNTEKPAPYPDLAMEITREVMHNPSAWSEDLRPNPAIVISSLKTMGTAEDAPFLLKFLTATDWTLLSFTTIALATIADEQVLPAMQVAVAEHTRRINEARPDETPSDPAYVRQIRIAANLIERRVALLRGETPPDYVEPMEMMGGYHLALAKEKELLGGRGKSPAAGPPTADADAATATSPGSGPTSADPGMNATRWWLVALIVLILGAAVAGLVRSHRQA